MKNDTTFVRMRSGDHLGDVQMSKKGTSSHEHDEQVCKIHKDSPSGKKVKLNLTRAIELSETAVFVYNFL